MPKIWKGPSKSSWVPPEALASRSFRGATCLPSARKRVSAEKKSTVPRNTVLKKGLQTLLSAAYAKFDESVDVAVRLGVDPRHADQMVRGTCVLPHGTGKTVRVLVFAKGEKEKEALDAGADYVGGEELAKKIQEGWLDFDKAVATPDMMGVVGKLGKILGPTRHDA